MSSSGTDKSRPVEQAAEQTGDFAAHNTASDAPAARPADADGKSDPLLSLLRPPQADGELGRLAHFAVTRLLGRGGMGAVFAADDLLLHRKVALKVMRPELTARPEARERFLREAQTAGGLEHDHVIPVHQIGEDNGVHFIAMPLLKGEALDERLKREGQLPIPAVLKIGRETAEGLEAAHAQGLIHRDIKPGNLWLEGTGEAGGPGFRRVKILDFGLARAAQDDQHLTADGGVLGTPAYMAPEQAAGAQVDHRTDLFSLGVVLYRCCAGETPFHGPNTMATLSALANKNAVPVAETNPGVPAALADLIMRLLAKAPGDRPQSAAEVAEALRRIEQEHAAVTAEAPPPAPRRRRVSALTLCVAALLVLGLAAVVVGIVVKVRTPDGKETQVTVPTGSKVDVDAKGSVTVALSADGANNPADPPELEFRLKEGSASVYGLVVAPDGKTIVAGYADGQLRVWNLETRQVFRSYVASSGVTALALHPDGKTVAAMCNDGSLFTWDIQKGEVIRQFTGYPVHASGVTFAKKGDLIVTPDRETQAVVCWDATTGDHRILARFPDEPRPLYAIEASPDGEQVAVTTVQGPARLLNVASGGVVWTSRWRGNNQVFAKDKRIPFANAECSIVQWNPDAKEPEKVFLGQSSRCPFWLAVSPHGRFVAAAGGFSRAVGLWAQDGPVYPLREWYDLTSTDAMRVAFTADSHRLIAAYAGGTICVFKIPENVPVRHGFPPLDPDWLARTAKLSPDEQVKEVKAELCRRNPGFNDPIQITFRDGERRVVGVRVETTQLEDISPFRAFPVLTVLAVRGNGLPGAGIGRLSDISCLKGMNLTDLDLGYDCVRDLSPLRDLPLSILGLESDPVSDLSPLQQMKLQRLWLNHSLVYDISLLRGMPLEEVGLLRTGVTDLAPPSKCPLKAISFDESLNDIEPLRELPLEAVQIGYGGTCSPQLRKMLESIPTLKQIDGMPAADFWKAIDAGDKPMPGG